MTQAQITDRHDAKAFVLAGRAEFSLRSKKTNKHYTFSVRKDKRPESVYKYVHVERHEQSPLYLGVIINNTHFYRDKKRPDTPAHKAFNWFWYHALLHDEQWSKCEMYHLGRCAKCHRRLTDPDSIRTGLGPICAGRMK